MSFFRSLINKLKTINFPWKKHKFIGYDLSGNMYFEGPPVRSGMSRSHRMMNYAHGEVHISDYNPNAIPVAWQLWLRHTRIDRIVFILMYILIFL